MSCHKCICRHLPVAKAKFVISLKCGMANFTLSQANGYERISKRIVLFYLNYASKRGLSLFEVFMTDSFIYGNIALCMGIAFVPILW